MSVIKIDHLTKMYGKARGVSDISFEVEEGEIFGFIGPNGAGKSTTIRTLLGLIHPTSGGATIFGKDITVAGPDIAEDIGYLPSEVFYYDHMKVNDLLKYSASFYKKDCSHRIKELAELLDLDLTRKIDDLSLGNKKKVGIIQGLLHEPKLLILDEPTSGLDPLMQQKFFNLLREENKKGVTILFSSHILSEVQRLCDRVAIIKDGEIVQVERISVLKEKNHKSFKVEPKGELDLETFNLPGVTDLKWEHHAIRFLYQGDINDMMRKIAEVEIANVWIEEPDLEEIFMHYYEKEA